MKKISFSSRIPSGITVLSNNFIDEYMTAITKGDGICARLIVGHIGKHYLAPTLSAVTAEGSGQTPVARAAQNLKPAIRMTKDGRLDALDGLDF